jgi:hypothetical protein
MSSCSICGLQYCRCESGIDKVKMELNIAECAWCIHNSGETHFIPCLDCESGSALERDTSLRYNEWLQKEYFPDLEEVESGGEQTENDIVNKPLHYNTGNIETIDYIIDTIYHPESYCIGNVLKYVSRYRHKGGLLDLRKAKYYLDKVIKLMED